MLKLYKDGASPRAIAKETNPAIRMVQTIVDEKDGADRTSKKYAEIRKHELKRHVMISYGVRKNPRPGGPAGPGAQEVRQGVAEAMMREAVTSVAHTLSLQPAARLRRRG
jgi:hypothetical protein